MIRIRPIPPPGSVAALALGLLFAGACQLPYFLMAKEPKRKVAAEFDKLDGSTAAVVVWCDQATLDEDYAARHRTAEAVRYFLARHAKGAKLVDARVITDFQERSGSDWESMTNVDLGRRFKAEFVIRIDLLEYAAQVRDVQAVRRSRVRATVAVYDVARSPADRPVYTTEVVGSYPEGQKADVLDLSDVDMLNGAVRVFGERVAQKFHAHEVSY
jgi:hypothetical protein